MRLWISSQGSQLRPDHAAYCRVGDVIGSAQIKIARSGPRDKDGSIFLCDPYTRRTRSGSSPRHGVEKLNPKFLNHMCPTLNLPKGARS